MKEGEVIEVSQTDLEEEVTDHCKREKLLKERRSHTKMGEGTSEDTKREIFSFWHCLTFLT